MNFWASVSFEAQGGRISNFLQSATENNFKLRGVKYVLGGVSGKCKAQNYAKLSKIAKKYKVKLKLKQKHGLYFKIRPLLSCKAVFVACLVFFVFLLWSQNFIWYIHFVGANEAQIARIRRILWQSNEVTTGTYITKELLENSKQALLNWDNEFSWVSLNFNSGRLVVEVIPAKDVPTIKTGHEADLIAKRSGTIIFTNIEQGTALVQVGQEVAKGQVLVSAARLEHDQETLVYSQTAAEIKAQFIWECEIEQELAVNLDVPCGTLQTSDELYIFGQLLSLPWQEGTKAVNNISNVRNYQPNFLGFALPATVIETNYIKEQNIEYIYTKEQALFLARETCTTMLFQEFADAQLLHMQEEYFIENGKLHYKCAYNVVANIATPAI